MRAILSFLFLCCVSSAQVNEPDRLMQAFTDRAMADQVARMATDERIKMYETLANYKPGDFHDHSLLAASFIQKMRETMDPGYLDRASKIVDAVLSADGADYEALRLRSQIELERHNFTKVAEYSRELIASSPEDPWNWGTLGDSLMGLGQYDKAAEAYQRMEYSRELIASSPEDPWNWGTLGDSLMGLGQYDKAAEAYQRMEYSRELIASSPEDPWNWGTLGDSLMELGQYDKAAEAYQRMEYSRELIASSPEDPWNWGTLGDSLRELGQYDKAAEAYQRMEYSRELIASSPEDPWNWGTLGSS